MKKRVLSSIFLLIFLIVIIFLLFVYSEKSFSRFINNKVESVTLIYETKEDGITKRVEGTIPKENYNKLKEELNEMKYKQYLVLTLKQTDGEYGLKIQYTNGTIIKIGLCDLVITSVKNPNKKTYFSLRESSFSDAPLIPLISESIIEDIN